MIHGNILQKLSLQLIDPARSVYKGLNGVFAVPIDGWLFVLDQDNYGGMINPSAFTAKGFYRVAALFICRRKRGMCNDENMQAIFLKATHPFY